jgi:mono/diheme cytochrome c family protein
MLEKGIFPKAVILLFGIITFVSSAATGADLLAGPIIVADATGAKKKKWKTPQKWTTPKKQETSKSSDDEWKAMGMKDELKTAQGNYQLYCSGCHGINGDGKGDLADMLEVPPRDHTDYEYMSDRTDEQLFQTISKGGAATGFDEAMPPHNTVIIEKEIRGLVKYLRKLCKCKYKEE